MFKEIDKLKEMFKKFELENQPLIKELPVFLESEKKTFLSLDIKENQILNDITMAINRTRKEIMSIKEAKDTKLKNLFAMDPINECKRLKVASCLSLEESVHSMR